MDGIEASMSHSDIIVMETLKRKKILLELNDSRSPDANRRKLKAWNEIRAIIQVQCKKMMSITQIKRVWRNRKAHVRDVLLRHSQGTGRGRDFNLEKTIARASASLTEAETKLAQCLGREAVMSGLGRMETFVEKQSVTDSPESTLEGTSKGWRDDGRAERGKNEVEGRRRSGSSCAMNQQSYAYKKRNRSESTSDFSDSTSEDSDFGWGNGGKPKRLRKEEGRGREKRLGYPLAVEDQSFVHKEKSSCEDDCVLFESKVESSKNGWRSGGWAEMRQKKDDENSEEKSYPQMTDEKKLGRTLRKRMLQQPEDFDSDCSTVSIGATRQQSSDRAINELQLTVLKKQQALNEKKSRALDLYIDVLRQQQQFYATILKESLQVFGENNKHTEGSHEKEMLSNSDYTEGDLNLEVSEDSKPPVTHA
ncbi:unnamed protein product [Cylicocyclus nassatus]|uniref:Regulatory protein zeste n=1 Tax=Cylicocyclus nassatus TaxID=53992 RepID=A0AA36GF31_CYLNA|nr:unnamed protein product [Cylicocyclus nassatus]